MSGDGKVGRAVSSMTGFGASTLALAGRRYVLELRSVNHRYLDLKLSLPRSLAPHEPAMVARVRQRLRRGRVEIGARPSGNVPGDQNLVEVDQELARAIHAALEDLRGALGIDAPVTLDQILAVRDVVRLKDDLPAADEEALVAVIAAMDSALDALQEMRRREGAALAEDLQGAVSEARELVDRLCARATERAEEHVDRLRARLTRLAEKVASPPVDESRLAQEVLVLADRLDVSEELARLASHFGQLETLLGDGGEIGRQVDFLVQEMRREANTLGAKSHDVEMTRDVVGLKSVLERMREQAANLE